jgi:DNA-directed RNA polymerase specialized sigma24 family protein
LKRDSFEDHWPAITRALDPYLTRRGVPRSLRDDLIQETGFRLLVTWDKVSLERPLIPLAITIARNLLIDHARTQLRWGECSQVVPDDAVNSNDVEEAALARVELGKVRRALTQLSSRHRHCLLAEVGAMPSSSRETAAAKMLRSRARRNLRMLLERASCLILPLRQLLHDITRRTDNFTNRLTGDQVIAVQATLMAVVSLFVPFGPHHGIGGAFSPPDLPPSASVQLGGLSGAKQITSILGSPMAWLDESSTSRSDGGPLNRGAASDPQHRNGIFDDIPEGEGETYDELYLGPDGARARHSNSGKLADHKARVELNVQYDMPRCVREALEGRPSTKCKLESRLRVNAKVRIDDSEYEIDHQ